MRWIPAILLAVLQASAWSALFAGGMAGVMGWAPIDSIVRATHEGEPDEAPGKSNNVKHPTGNFAALEMPTRTFLVLAHLQPGSVVVKVGDSVKEGQTIGRCGNSGHTSEPHIHIHHQRQNPAMFPVNFAEGLPLFFRDLDGPAMPEGGVEKKDGQVIARGAEVRHIDSAKDN